jgi:hypothetical protein
MLSKSVITLLLSCTAVLAAPLDAKPRDVNYDYGYGKYASYGTYPPPPGMLSSFCISPSSVPNQLVGGYGKYASYGTYGAYKRNAAIKARDVERRHDDYDYGYGKYASYGTYPPPPGMIPSLCLFRKLFADL